MGEYTTLHKFDIISRKGICTCQDNSNFDNVLLRYHFLKETDYPENSTYEFVSGFAKFHGWHVQVKDLTGKWCEFPPKEFIKRFKVIKEEKKEKEELIKTNIYR